MPSSSPSSIQKSYKYHVFISFRGEDTRDNIVGLIYLALKGQGIYTFLDNEELEKGRRIDDLFKAIEDSKIFIIVFSKRYASSSWCLRELEKIMEGQPIEGDQTDGLNQIVYPVFYDVNPSEVRKSSGQFHKDLAKFKNKLEVQKWKEALNKAGSRSGWDLRNKHLGNEIKDIVDRVSLKLRSMPVNVDDYQIGMASRMHDVESSLGIGVNDVRMIGIKGMGGVGKTTLAHAIFDKVSFQFDGASFVADVREKAISDRLELLQRQILLDILGKESIPVTSVHEGKRMMNLRLPYKKVLVVLDDVDQREQLDALAGKLKWFGPGSRIIITTRDAKVLVAHGVKMVHDVSLLTDQEAIRLFSWHAFKKEIPIHGYEELSSEIVNYAGGLPLAIRVLGSNLHDEEKSIWEDMLKRLKDIPLEKKVLEMLEISYIGLEDDHKKIFLDVACFMKGFLKDDAIRILESRGFYAITGLNVLEQKSLITISNQRLGMHDLIEEMGMDIVRRVDPEDPKKHSRLWIRKEIKDILLGDSVSEAIGYIRLEPVELSFEVVMNGLEKLKNLRALRFSEKDDSCVCSDWSFNQGKQYFSNKLQFLNWEGYPFWSLPQTFQGEELVGLELPQSKITQLWESGGEKVLNNLRFLDLSYSKLKRFNLEITPKLERLDLKCCQKLVELHSPVGSLKSLVYLNLDGCSNFRYNSVIKLLESLDLLSLPKLEVSVESSGEPRRYTDDDLPILHFTCSYSDEASSPNGNPQKFVSLNLPPRTKLESISSSIRGLQHLRQLTIYGCIPEIPEDIYMLTYLEKLNLFSTHIKHLPDSICNLKHLKSLKLKSCSHLEDLPENLGELECLEKLSLLDTSVKHLPDSICILKCLKSLKLQSCSLLERVPQNLGNLEYLEKLDMLSSCIKHLPDSICWLKRLKSLKLESCWLLEKLPEDLGQLKCLEKLILAHCISLQDIPDSICNIESLKCFRLSFCNKVEKLPEEIGKVTCLVELDIKGTGISHLPQSISSLNGLHIFGSTSVLQSCDFATEIQTSETGTFCQIQTVNHTEAHTRNLSSEAQRNQLAYTYCNGYFISAMLVGALSVGALFITQYM